MSVIFCLIGRKHLLLYVGPFPLKWLPISVAFVSEIRLDILGMLRRYLAIVWPAAVQILTRPSSRFRSYCIRLEQGVMGIFLPSHHIPRATRK